LLFFIAFWSHLAGCEWDTPYRGVTMAV